MLEQLDDFQTHQRQRGVYSDFQSTVQALSTLSEAYSEFQAGLATKIDVVITPAYHSEAFRAQIAPVRSQVMALVLPRYLGLPDEVRPKPGEGPYQFLDRVAADATARDDYLLAAKARETAQYLRDGRADGNGQTVQADLFVTAQHEEVAGQYAPAVSNYERALATPSNLVPAKVIGARLSAIKAEHPQEYQQGMESYLAPAPPPSRYPYGYLGGFGAAPFNRPGQPPPPPSLAIPAAPTPPPASASPSPSVPTTPPKP